MNIPETDYAEINLALTEVDNLYQVSPRFGEDIMKKAQLICAEACERPEFWEGGFNMDAGLEAVVRYLRTHYPWLSPGAIWAIRHKCFMNYK